MENILVLVQLWALTQDKFTTKKLAKFLNVSEREARKYIRILKEREIIKDLGNVYVLEKLDDKAGELLTRLIEKIVVIQGNTSNRNSKIKAELSKVYEILLDAQDYCVDEYGDVLNYQVYDDINDALKIIESLLHILK